MVEQAVLIGLAAWRITSLLVNEAGPFDIFECLRSFIGVKSGLVEGFFPTLFSCIWCLSIWIVISCYLLWVLEPVVIILLAAMAIVVITDKIIHLGNLV